MASGSRLSKEDWKKQKELEEARKAGTAPAELDEDGKEINPHIPQYIAQAPWYLNKNVPSLKHQRAFQQKPEISKEWYERGKFLGPPSIKYRKGACKNCGAMTHNEKNCCERPRKLGAKWTGKDIKPDEVIKELVLDFDSKRDRWNGYDPSEYDKLFEQYEKTEKERRERKKKRRVK
jgi:pre-mRNA-processing factor SLU7